MNRRGYAHSHLSPLASLKLAAIISVLMLCSTGWAQSNSDASARDDKPSRDSLDRAVTDFTPLPWVRNVPLVDRKRAYQLFLDGNDLMKQGLFRQGAEKYRDALALWDHPAFHFNLSVAQMNLDQIIKAYEGFEKARMHGPRPIGEDKYEQAQYYLNVLGNQLSELEIVCREPDAAVAIDGTPLFHGPGERRIRVRPGRHRVDANKDGREADIQELVLAPGDKKRVVLQPQLPALLVTERYWPVWVPTIITGAGLAIAGGSRMMQMRASGLFDEYDGAIGRLCTGPNGCRAAEVPTSLRRRLDQANQWQWGARIGYAVGGAAITSSVILFFLNRERAVIQRRSDESAVQTFMPTAIPNGAGIHVQIQF